MAKIATYTSASQLSSSDKVIGTDVSDSDETKNFTLSAIAEFVNGLSSVERQMYAWSTSNQVPSGLDSVTQIEFGAGAGTISDPIQVDVSGVIRVNIDGSYLIRFTGNIDKKTTPGVSVMYIRALIDGSQYGPTIVREMDTLNLAIPFEMVFPYQFTAGQQLTFEFFISSSGVNAGGFYAKTTTPALFDDVPSASIEIYRYK